MKCCICGTIRNCGPYLDKIFENMELIGSLFEDYKIILYYDQSDDNTLDKIKNYQIKNTRLIFYCNLSPLLPYRTHRIAKGRNACLDIIRQQYSDYDYFIMMDCDDKCALDMNIETLNYYLLRNKWDSLSFQHPCGYYDSWALSKVPFVASCHHFEEAYKGKGVQLITDIINKTPDNALINCISAFNGFAIYRTNKFLDCKYDGNFRLDYIPKQMLALNIKYAGKMNIKDAKEDCEHRFFHFSAFIKNSARIRISPKCLFR